MHPNVLKHSKTSADTMTINHSIVSAQERISSWLQIVAVLLKASPSLMVEYLVLWIVQGRLFVPNLV